MSDQELPEERVRAFVVQVQLSIAALATGADIAYAHGVTLTLSDLRDVLNELAEYRRQLEAAEEALEWIAERADVARGEQPADRLLYRLRGIRTKATEALVNR